MTPAQFMIFVGSVTLIVFLGIMYVKWESRYATTYQQKKERKRRQEFARQQSKVDTKKEVKKGVEVLAK